MNFQVKDIRSIPIIFCNDINKLKILVKQNISISKTDWYSFETSWDFLKHPFLRIAVYTHWPESYDEPSASIKFSFEHWLEFTTTQFNQLKQNEEELNKIFIDI